MKQNIYRSAALVTVFSTVEKALSFFYRIVLSRIIGAEGLGIYQICLSVFAVFLTAASSGIPVTVSRLMAKNGAKNDIKGKNAAVTAGVVATLMFTVPMAIILFFGRNLLGFLFTDDRCMNVFILLLPGLILTSIYAVMRGSFWGNKQFLPYSIIELLEDAVMVVLGCILVYGVTDPVAGAERAAVAVLVSYVFSFIVSLFWYFKKGGRFSNPKRQLKPLFSSSMPITAMRTSTSVLNSAVAILLPVLLMNAYGLTNSEAISLYGVAIGMSVPILFIPSALIGSISVVVAPELAENYYKNKTALVKFDIEKSVKAAIFIATLIIPVLFVLGDEIGSVLYSNEMSGEIIQNCAFILLPMCLAMITTTVLNSMNCEKKTLLYYIIGAALMIVSIVALTRFVGVYSYMIGLAASFVISAVFNLRLLAKKCEGIKFISYILRSIVVVIATCAFGMMLDGIISRYVATVWQMVICAPACLIFASAFLMCFEMFSFKPFKKLFKKA
ncbi:MAG: oligosaccharide flippase family protein [Clostridia bacterium]|nr:oligosaccharide flippase family protein [Clostridia bacterium]